MPTLLVTVRSSDESDTVRDTGVEVLAIYPTQCSWRPPRTRRGASPSRASRRWPYPSRRCGSAARRSPSTTRCARRRRCGSTRRPGDGVLPRQAGRAARARVAGHRPWSRGDGPQQPRRLHPAGWRAARTDRDLRAQSWVLDVTPFRPAMKCPRRCGRVPHAAWDAGELSGVDAAISPCRTRISSRSRSSPAESTHDIAALVRSEGGTVLSRSRTRSWSTPPRPPSPGWRTGRAFRRYCRTRCRNHTTTAPRPSWASPPTTCSTARPLTGAGQMVGIADTHPRQTSRWSRRTAPTSPDDAQTYRSPVSRPGAQTRKRRAAVAGYRAKPAGLPG